MKAAVRDEVRQFATEPAEFFGFSYERMHHLDPDELAALQVDGLQLRFAELREEIPVLTRMADEQGVDEIETVDAVVPLLFQHSVYKSFPALLLEKNRFTDLTRWLDRLTTHDLSSVDVADCDSIDAWLDVLDAETPLRVVHSSGTTGTMSFLPRSADESRRMFEAARCGLFQFSDPGGRHDQREADLTLIWPLHRSGRGAITRVPQMAVQHILASEDQLYPLREGRISSDAMYLAGRLRAAAARGELDQLEINPALRARREAFEREQREIRDGLERFISGAIDQLRGSRVWIFGNWNTLHEMARSGLDRGLSSVFTSDSLVTAGGGAKGQVVAEGWEEDVKRFVGVERLQHVYAMTELTGMNKLCREDRYHFEPWVVPYVLDPEDGEPLPRRGSQIGRAAFFDLLPDSYWGGFITGDEVSIDWTPCHCGQTTPHIARKIERYSEKQGGDDKITCAASDQAHQAALDFLNTRLA